MMAEAVEGFMPAAGLAVLRDLARGKRVLEIGCWKGRTALAMAEVADAVFTVDHFRGDAYTGQAHTLPDFWRYLNDHPASHRVRLLIGPIGDILPALNLGWFDLVFYDADHNYEPTRDFLAVAIDHCRPDATIVVDDYSSAYPQVMQAVADVLQGTPRRTRVAGALAILETP